MNLEKILHASLRKRYFGETAVMYRLTDSMIDQWIMAVQHLFADWVANSRSDLPRTFAKFASTGFSDSCVKLCKLTAPPLARTTKLWYGKQIIGLQPPYVGLHYSRPFTANLYICTPIIPSNYSLTSINPARYTLTKFDNANLIKINKN